MKTIVFDFDKTLTYKDTMNQFFFWRMRGIRALYLPIFLGGVFLVKIKIITVKKFKEICIRLLAPNSKDQLLSLFKEFSDKIELAESICILNEKVKDGNRVIILSASPIYYLKEIFPMCEIIGTTFTFNLLEEFQNVAEHPYGKDKCTSFIKKGITSIDELYYDSKSDEELFSLCKTAYKVKNGKIIKIIKL